jgi:acylphosphatase
MKKQFKAHITGLVHGVMFRDFVRRSARRLGLVGYVKNSPSGPVEVIAEGDQSDLEELVSLLRKGPPLARVDEVTFEWADATGQFNEFSIHYQGFLDRL